MHGIRKLLWGTAVAVSLLAVLAACSSGPKIVYEVSGTAEQVDLFYRDRRGDMVQKTVSLPWDLSFRASDPFDFEIDVYSQEQGVTVSCAVLVNDSEVGRVEGRTFAECRGTYRVGVADFQGQYDLPTGGE
ncbi:MAG: hypothetical protein H6662_05890 [Ardenticatenaceae bacterium]|nr:hypothetical protein [Anaerolineales bacterium]MCB8921096.1 hypothetical protein [Ardenticatenaceae bacterium]